MADNLSRIYQIKSGDNPRTSKMTTDDSNPIAAECRCLINRIGLVTTFKTRFEVLFLWDKFSPKLPGEPPKGGFPQIFRTAKIFNMGMFQVILSRLEPFLENRFFQEMSTNFRTIFRTICDNLQKFVPDFRVEVCPKMSNF